MDFLTTSKMLVWTKLAVIAWLISGTPAFAAERHVPTQYATIQAAINASVNGDEVVVADGVYTGASNKNLNFNGRLITLRSAGGNPAACTINCQNSGRAFTFDHNETSAAVVSGLTIVDSQPAAINVSSGAPTIIRCVFSSNGGMSGLGGAIAISGTPGGAVQIRDCSFVANTAERGGGVMVNGGSVVISNSGFFGNRAETTLGLGGAIYAYPDSRLQVVNSVFSGNFAGGYGGAIRANGCQLHLVNSTLYGNTSPQDGGGIRAANATMQVTNCILWANAPQQVYDDGGGSTAITYSDVQDGFAGTGNVNVNPNFADPNGPDNILGTADDDLRVGLGSPVIDSGNNVPFHYQSAAAQWLHLRLAPKTYAFDQFKPGIAGGTGCTTNGDWQPTLPLDGGTVELTANGSTGIFYCPITDGSTTPAVSDGALSAPIATLRIDFVPPVTAFYTYYGSLAVGDTATMKLFRNDVQIAQYTSGASADSVDAIGHGFSSLVPIDRVDITTTDTNTVVGAFVGLASGDTSLGTVNIPGYAGPTGATVQKDFGVVFGGADLPGDLDGHLRVVDGAGSDAAVVDMGAYEFNPCPADANGDGAVNVNDLLTVISAWGATTPNPADITGDGIVNVNDLLAVITHWGACP